METIGVVTVVLPSVRRFSSDDLSKPCGWSRPCSGLVHGTGPREGARLPHGH